MDPPPHPSRHPLFLLSLPCQVKIWILTKSRFLLQFLPKIVFMHFTFSSIPWILTLKVLIPNSLIFWYCYISTLFQCRYVFVLFFFCFFARNPHYFGSFTSQVQRRFLYASSLTFNPLWLSGIYRITKIVRSHWLAERSVCISAITKSFPFFLRKVIL